MVPIKSTRGYEPRVFGFKVHAAATLMRWQDRKRDDMKIRVKGAGLETGFKEEETELDDEMEDDDM